MNLLPFLIILGFFTASLAIVYLGASIYFRFKNSQWEAAMARMDAEEPTAEELAIDSEWVTHPLVDNPDKIPMPQGEEMEAHYAARAVRELELYEGKQPLDYEESTKIDSKSSIDELIQAMEAKFNWPATELKKFKDALHKAQQILEEEAQDEAFYQKTLEEQAFTPTEKQKALFEHSLDPIVKKVKPETKMVAAVAKALAAGDTVVFLDESELKEVAPKRRRKTTSKKRGKKR